VACFFSLNKKHKLMIKKKNNLFPVALCTGYLVLYVLFLLSEETFRLAMLMFSLSPFVLIWMIVRVLKHGTPGTKTFDRYFYDDENYERAGTFSA
jgi:hypothetical protein